MTTCFTVYILRRSFDIGIYTRAMYTPLLALFLFMLMIENLKSYPVTRDPACVFGKLYTSLILTVQSEYVAAINSKQQANEWR